MTPLIGTCATFGTTHWAETVLKLSPEAAVMTAPDQLVVAMFVGAVMAYNFPVWFDRSRLSGTLKGVKAKFKYKTAIGLFFKWFCLAANALSGAVRFCASREFGREKQLAAKSTRKWPISTVCRAASIRPVLEAKRTCRRRRECVVFDS